MLYRKDEGAETLINVEINGRMLKVPSFMICPITRDIMRWPVVNITGHSFEKSAIIQWLGKTNRTCPLTRKPTKPSDFISNHSLRRQIQEWKRSHGLSMNDDEEAEEEEFGMYPVTGVWLVSDNAWIDFLRECDSEQEPANQSFTTEVTVGE